MYVIGDDIDFTLDAYLDSQGQSPTDLCDFEITTENISVDQYIKSIIDEHYGAVDDAFYYDQIYNLYLHDFDMALDYSFFTKGDFLSGYPYRYMKAFVYTCELPPGSENEMTVAYDITCSWNREKTKDPIFSHEYLLSPAKGWSSFQNLTIEVLPPAQAPYLIDSSIDFIQTDQGTYTAFLEELPDDELTFSLYSKKNTYGSRNFIMITVVSILTAACAIYIHIKKQSDQ